MNLEQLKALFAKLQADARAISTKAAAEKRDLTEAEKADAKKFLDEADVRRVEIEKLEKAEADAKLSQRLAELDKAAELESKRTVPSPAPGRASIEVVEHRDFPMRGEKGAFETREQAYKTGMWLRGAIYGNAEAARWSNDYGYRVDPISSGSAAAGAVLAPDELSRQIIWYRNQVGVAAQFAQTVPMSSDSLVIPKSLTECTVYAIGETSTTDTTTSNPTFEAITLTALQWMGVSTMTRNIAEDSVIDLANYVAQKQGYAFAKIQDKVVFAGDGTATYHSVTGITNAGADGALGAGSTYTTASNIDAYSELAIGDITSTMGILPAYATEDLAFYCSKFVYSHMLRVAAAASGNSIGTITAGSLTPQIMGYPVRFVDSMDATTGDCGNKIGFLFGSLRQAVALGQRAKFSFLVDPYTLAGQNAIRLIGYDRWAVNIHDVGGASTAGAITGCLMNNS